jgi:hypothetical protein
MTDKIKTREQAAVVAIRFANYRRENGLSTKTATVAKLGIPAHRIRKLLDFQGGDIYYNRLFTDQTAEMLAKSMGVTVEYLCGFDPTDDEKQEAIRMIDSSNAKMEEDNLRIAERKAEEAKEAARREANLLFEKYTFLFNRLGYGYHTGSGLHRLTSQRLGSDRQILLNEGELGQVLQYLSRQLDFAVLNLIESKKEVLR